MDNDRKRRLLNGLRDSFKYATSRRVRPIFKGTLAYMIAYILIFTRRFDELSRYPLALSSMFIVTMTFGPGKPLGACWQAVGLGMSGVLLGAGFFAILAKLALYPVAQAIVFAIIVYAMSIIKTFGQRWFSFSLLSILMAFNGIFTSLSLNGVFSPTYLLEYLKAYSWGAAIVFAVNMFVFPRTSERELRKTIVTSLEHLATFAALVGKAYTLTGTSEDKAARELLSQTIKADFTFLSQKIEETSVEINWSKYSMQDYQCFTDRIRMLQRTLITAHISLLRFDDQDVEIFKAEILPHTKLAFQRLRRDIDLTIREVGEALGYGPMYVKATQVGYLQCLDQQRAAYDAGQNTAQRTRFHDHNGNRKSHGPEDSIERGEGAETSGKAQEDLAAVSKRLQEELGVETPAHPEFIPIAKSHAQKSSTNGIHTMPPTVAGTSSDTETSALPTAGPAPARLARSPSPGPPKPKYGPGMMKKHFEEFQSAQRDLFVNLLTSSDPGDEANLKIHEPGPSINEMYGGEQLSGMVDEGDLHSRVTCASRKFPFNLLPVANPLADLNVKKGATDDNFDDDSERELRKKEKEKDKQTDDSSSIGPTPAFKTNETLVRVYSLMFAWDRFVENLASLHKGATKNRRSRIHVHVYETLARPGEKPMSDPDSDNNERKSVGESREEARELSIEEALAVLEDKPYTPVKMTWLQTIAKWNQWLKGDRSIFAGKCAAAASVFALLIFADTTRQWFISYTLTSGLLTCIVALAPTLGQSLMTFVLQISGSGFGTLIGWALLQISRNVGGYHYNPYGICAMMALVAIPLQYLIYERPQWFILGLLALNAAGSIIVTEHIYVNYEGTQRFDTPALRAGKAMVSLGVALAIVVIFQLFVLRRPARSRLRKQLGKLVYSNLAYNTILQAYVRSVLPSDPDHACHPSVLKRIERELKHREAKMQMQIIELSPLIAYAAAEPSFGKPFRGGIIQNIIQANQIILDRLREGRAAIGDSPFDPFILDNMVAVLSPYRRRANRINKVGLYLCAMSLMSKSPLPHDSVLAQHVLNHFVHDALLISSQLTRTEEGSKAVKGDSFCRYWFYLLSVAGLQTQLKRIETACKDLFGELEDDPRLR